MNYFICTLLILFYLREYSAGTIILFEDINFEGRSYTFELGESECKNVDDDFNDIASSINTGGRCVFIFEHADCLGNWDQVSVYSVYHDNFDELFFNDMVSSISYCDRFSDNITPSQWVPSYRFFSDARCYPTDPANNGQCTEYDENAPVFYEARTCNDVHRIQYWLFYGWQQGCAVGLGGRHDDDWEFVVLNFRKCDNTWCLHTISFGQHGNWYTRVFRGRRNLRVFVGKIGHGNYHNSCCGYNRSFRWACEDLCDDFPGLECTFFGDFRDSDTRWVPTNLKSIEDAAAVNEKIRNHGARDTCSHNTCKDEGCKENTENEF